MPSRSGAASCVALACLLTLCVPAGAATGAPAGAATAAAPGAVPPTFALDRLIELARQGNPSLAAQRARVVGAEAGLITAAARPNPDVDVQAGHQSASGGTSPGMTGAIGVLQPIERTSLREARRDVALTSLAATRADGSVLERDLLTELRLRYYEVLRLQAAARLAEEDLSIAEQIRNRVQVRVSTGEAARFELIRADTERLNAQRAVRAAAARIDIARAELRRLVGPSLPGVFAVEGSLEDAVTLPPALESLRATLADRHPTLLAARAAVRNAEARLALERERRRPAMALRGGVDRVPGATDARIGVVVQVPIFDRREGPIAEAAADVERARFELADRELMLGQALDAAWQRYRIARDQVAAFEDGILREAQNALRVAESAYRFGERGILDVLDAQRTLRTLRMELNTTRYDLRVALVELERLRAEGE